MKGFPIYLVLISMSIICSCSNGQEKYKKYQLTSLEFSNKIKELSSDNIIDVRTPEEYSKGHLKNATNIDWKDSEFEKKISLLNKSQPVFVYCLSGGRSSSAAFKMRSWGFTKVYELKGGILNWRSAGLPETTNVLNKSTGMSREQFDSLLISDKLVLVDFYAPWCEPCKKMKPHLDELENKMNDKVIILRIDADKNSSLFKQLKLETLPTLLLYKDKNLVWLHSGYIDIEEISNHLM